MLRTPYGRMLVAAMLAAALLLAAGLILSRYQKEEAKKEKIMRGCTWVLFSMYLIFLFALLFVLGRGHQAPSPELYKLYLQRNTNFIPFKSITGYARIFWRQPYAMVNLVGNLFAFAPMGFFLPVLFKTMRGPLKFPLLVTLLVILVEALQLVTLTGACDIDDVLLNTLGAVAVFMLVRAKPIQKSLAKLHILQI